MALFTKQDFNPPMLSRKWVVMKVRPNMLLYARQHIISILESGLLFREDSVEVEQEAMLDNEERPWLTRGERMLGAASIGVALALWPPRRLCRTTLIHVATCLTLPLAIRVLHRRMCEGMLQSLLLCMRDYLALARRAAACLKECAALRAQLSSVSLVLDSMHTLLYRQQSSLAVVMARASSALLGNAPWLRADLAWDAVPQITDQNLLKIHHAFLVVQSSLLKHIALAHCTLPVQARRLYINHNERLYWIHTNLIAHLQEQFAQNYEALERMYRLLKNYGNSDPNVTKKPGAAIKNSWLYNDVHGGIARANLELKLALTKCNELDMFLDSCALNKQELDLEVLNKDIDDLIDHITTCLTTTQNAQIRLKKLQNKFNDTEKEENEIEAEFENDAILKIDDKQPEVKDEVFYFMKTDDDDRIVQSSGDISTAPGTKEREATEIVLKELRRKLLRREDVMRERERQALAKTMPDKKVPEFPRQINMEYAERRGFITKLPKRSPKKRLFLNYKIKPLKAIEAKNLKNMKRKRSKIDLESKDSTSTLYSASSNGKLLTIDRCSDTTIVTEWYNDENPKKQEVFDTSGMSEGLSDVESSAVNKNINHAVNFDVKSPRSSSKTLNQSVKNNEEASNSNRESSNSNQELKNSNQKLKNSNQEIKNSNQKLKNSNREKDRELKTSNQDSRRSHQVARNNNQEAKNSNQDLRHSNQEDKNNSQDSKTSCQEARNYRFSKRDLEMTSSSENESDFEAYKEQQVAILKDIRKNRAIRKKNHPDKRATQPSTMDEGLRPTEYSFGAGLAMASVLQVGGSGALGLRAGTEEQFVGDGEVSPDSGHDD